MEDLSDISNEKLIDGFRTGDETVIIELYKLIKLRLYKYVLNNSGTKKEAEELAWDCLERFRQKCLNPSFSLDIPCSQYLYGIYRYAWLDQLKAKKKDNIIIKTSPLEEGEEPNNEANLFKDLQSIESGDNQHLKELLNYIVVEINNLSEVCKGIFQMICFEQKKHSDVSETLGIKTSTSRKRLKDCRDKLRSKIQSNPLFSEYIDDQMILNFLQN